MIIQSFQIVAPIFALVGIGYGAAKLRMVQESASFGLSQFVFMIAIPSLIFRTVAGTELPSVNPFGYWAAYFIPLLIVWTIAAFIAGRMGRDRTERAVIGFATGQANTVMVGIPLILSTMGEAGNVPIILLLIVHLPFTMSVVTLLIERGNSASDTVRTLAKALVSHPILIAIFIGLLWRLTGLSLPGILRTILKYLGDAAAPCALVATGLSLSQISFAGHRRLIAVVAALKLLVHPFLVFALAHFVFKLPPVWTAAALLFAACPTGINAYLVAERYKAGQTIASGAIAISTPLGIISTTLAVAVAKLILG